MVLFDGDRALRNLDTVLRPTAGPARKAPRLEGCQPRRFSQGGFCPGANRKGRM